MCNKGGYKKEIRKRTRNTTVPVSFVSVEYSNYSARNKNFCNTDLGRRNRSGECGTSLLNSMCNKGGYKKEIT